MTPTNAPPRELVDHRKQLLREIAAEEEAIRTLRQNLEDRQQVRLEKQRVLAGVDLALRSVYGWDDPETVRTAPAPPDPGLERKISLAEYRDILVPYLREKRAARPVEMRRRVAAVVGFTITVGAFSKTLRRLSDDARVPIRRGADNLYLYDEAKRSPGADPPAR